jgi:hypothetical protein
MAIVYFANKNNFVQFKKIKDGRKLADHLELGSSSLLKKIEITYTNISMKKKKEDVFFHIIFFCSHQ